MRGFQPADVRTRCARALLLSALLGIPSVAVAEEPPAEALFREGRRLLADGHIAEACEKFAESQRIEPSSGALLNLARCHARAGMTATAQSEYLAAARLARAQQRTQQASEAELRATELAPQLIHLSIRFAAATPGAVVTRNGEPLAETELGVPIAVDPGKQVIRVAAQGYLDWTTSVVLTQPGQFRSIDVPALSPIARPPEGALRAENSAPVSPIPPSSPKVNDAEPPSHREVPVATWIAGSIGAAAFVSAGVLAWVAKSKWNDAHERGSCDGAHVCDREGLLETDRARNLGNLATAATAVGAAALTSALVFYLGAPERKTALGVGLGVGSNGAALGVRGGF